MPYIIFLYILIDVKEIRDNYKVLALCFLTGGAVVCSQYIGKGRDDESRKSGAQLETVLLIFSVIMTAFSVSFTRPSH